MDIQRFILFIVFSMSVLWLWEAWQREQHPAPPAPAAQTAPAAPGTPTPSPQLAGSQPAPAPAVPGVPPAAGRGALPAGAKILVKTDLLQAEIDAAGGDLRRLELLKHRDTEDRNKPFLLLQNQPDRVYVAQSGLIGDSLPNHKTFFSATPGAYELKEGVDKIEVRLAAPEAGGVGVTKVYTFHRGSYVIETTFEIANHGTAAVQPFAYFQMLRDGKPPVGSSRFVPTFTGAAVYTEQEKFQKVDFAAIDKDKTPYPKNADNGWIAMVQHYFVTAWLPKEKSRREFYTKRLGDNLYSAGVILPVGAVEPGKSTSLSVPLYAGPQEQDNLSKLGTGLNLVVDYGWLTVIASPLFWVLSQFYNWVKNWGVAIILLTVLIKILFYPLSAASYRSMAKMRVITPKLQRIKEQYGDDRQRLHQAMMELYKTEKINPLGGCLPIAIQIPVFIALYWVLLASVELRYAPFALWLDDLSAPDPYYVLPIVMGATMLIQTKLNPTPPDPIQARVMQIMPIAFSIFFFFFPAGLVLYWLVNNVLSIAQQWQITRAMERVKTAPHGKH